MLTMAGDRASQSRAWLYMTSLEPICLRYLLIRLPDLACGIFTTPTSMAACSCVRTALDNCACLWSLVATVARPHVWHHTPETQLGQLSILSGMAHDGLKPCMGIASCKGSLRRSGAQCRILQPGREGPVFT